jgi:ankyrin repeat protein
MSLSYAAANGYKAVVQQLLAMSNVDVDSEDQWGRTPLSLAAENGHEAVVKQLLDTGKINIDPEDGGLGWKPLWCAAKNGHVAVVKLLLDMSGEQGGHTLLSWAAEYGHGAVVEKLLDIGMADVDLEDTELGRTPLS